MKLSCAKKLLLILSCIFSFQAFSIDHLIYTVAEDLPMGFENETLRKNYYVTMGSEHGLSNGTVLNVYRVISKANPYDLKKRINYKVKIGELEVLHTEDHSAITVLKEFKGGAKDPLLDINAFMIGDRVEVAIK